MWTNWLFNDKIIHTRLAKTFLGKTTKVVKHACHICVLERTRFGTICYFSIYLIVHKIKVNEYRIIDVKHKFHKNTNVIPWTVYYLSRIKTWGSWSSRIVALIKLNWRRTTTYRVSCYGYLDVGVRMKRLSEHRFYWYRSNIHSRAFRLVVWSSFVFASSNYDWLK